MSAWGARLYDSDVALDVRDAFRDLARLPLDGAALVDLALARHPNAADPQDDDHTVFWLALADQFHRHGIAHAPLFDRAYALVDGGADDQLMAALDMDVRDRRKRAAALAVLRDSWTRPHPKPVRRHLLDGPEPHVVHPGEIWAYPTMDGNPINTALPAAEIAETFHPDGWNAFAVGGVGHQLGFFALAYYLRLHVESRECPDLAACRDAPISGVRTAIGTDDDPLVHAVGWASVTKAELRKMRALRLGRLDLSWERVQARLADTDGIAGSGRGSLAGHLYVYWRELDGDGFSDFALPLDVRLSDLLTRA